MCEFCFARKTTKTQNYATHKTETLTRCVQGVGSGADSDSVEGRKGEEAKALCQGGSGCGEEGQASSSSIRCLCALHTRVWEGRGNSPAQLQQILHHNLNKRARACVSVCGSVCVCACVVCVCVGVCVCVCVCVHWITRFKMGNDARKLLHKSLFFNPNRHLDRHTQTNVQRAHRVGGQQRERRSSAPVDAPPSDSVGRRQQPGGKTVQANHVQLHAQSSTAARACTARTRPCLPVNQAPAPMRSCSSSRALPSGPAPQASTAPAHPQSTANHHHHHHHHHCHQLSRGCLPEAAGGCARAPCREHRPPAPRRPGAC